MTIALLITLLLLRHFLLDLSHLLHRCHLRLIKIAVQTFLVMPTPVSMLQLRLREGSVPDFTTLVLILEETIE